MKFLSITLCLTITYTLASCQSDNDTIVNRRRWTDICSGIRDENTVEYPDQVDSLVVTNPAFIQGNLAQAEMLTKDATWFIDQAELVDWAVTETEENSVNSMWNLKGTLEVYREAAVANMTSWNLIITAYREDMLNVRYMMWDACNGGGIVRPMSVIMVVIVGSVAMIL